MIGFSLVLLPKKGGILNPRIQLFPTLVTRVGIKLLGQLKKNYHSEENNSLSFSKGNLIHIYKESLGWGIGRAGDKIGYFPLKYVAA